MTTSNGTDRTFGYNHEKFVRLVANMRFLQKIGDDPLYKNKAIALQIECDGYIEDYMKPIKEYEEKKKALALVEKIPEITQTKSKQYATKNTRKTEQG